MNAGDTYRRTSGGCHLWIVISDPQRNPHEIIAVNLTSQRSWQDQSCIVLRGEHPFVRHESVVFYAEAKQTTAAQLEANFAKNLIQWLDPVPPELLRRIRDGARISARLPIGLKAILQAQGVI